MLAFMPDVECKEETNLLQTVLKPARIEWQEFQAEPVKVARDALKEHRVAYVGNQDDIRMILVHSCLAAWLTEQCELAIYRAMKEYRLWDLADDHPIADQSGYGDMGNPFGPGKPTTLEALTNSGDPVLPQFGLPSVDVWCHVTDPELTWQGVPLLFAADPDVWEAMLAYLQDVTDLTQAPTAKSSEEFYPDHYNDPFELSLSMIPQGGKLIADALAVGRLVRVFAHGNPLQDHLYTIVPWEADDDTDQLPAFALSALYTDRDKFSALLKEATEDIVIKRRGRPCGKVKAA